MCTINIIFDRVGKKDPITQGSEILTHRLGMDVDLTAFAQPLSGWCPCSHFDSGPSYQSYKVLLRYFFLRNIKRNRHVLCTADGNVLCEVKAINLSGKVTNNLKLDSVKNFGNS